MRSVGMKRKSKSRDKREKVIEETDPLEDTNSNGSESADASDDTPEPENKRRKPSKSKKKSKSVEQNNSNADDESDENEEDQDADESNEDSNKNGSSEPKSKKGDKKRGKSKKQEKAKEVEEEGEDEDDDDDDDVDYEVEEVIGEKVIRGVHHFLIRWKGYDASNDTWEPESTLNCADLIKKFRDAQSKKNGTKSEKSSKKQKKHEKKTPEPQEQWDENEEFEVDKIIEVHHRRDGGREFLVSWKGYSAAQNSWEPEENLNCADLINRFMSKVEKLKVVDQRNLREKRKHTDRLTLSTNEKGRRLSKRHQGKQRVQYHDAE